MAKMGQFVGDDVVDEPWGSLDDTPTEPELPGGIATSPSALGITEKHHLWPYVKALCPLLGALAELGIGVRAVPCDQKAARTAPARSLDVKLRSTVTTSQPRSRRSCAFLAASMTRKP